MVMIIVTSPVDSREATERMNKTRGPREEIWILALCAHSRAIIDPSKEGRRKATTISPKQLEYDDDDSRAIEFVQFIKATRTKNWSNNKRTNEPNKLQEKSRTNGHHLKLFPYYYRRCWCSIFVPFFPFKTGNCVEWWSGIINSIKKNEPQPSFDHPESHDSKAREEEGAAAKKSGKSN